MNKNILKIVSAGLVFAMVLPAASCGQKGGSGKKSRSGDKVSSDTPWFESRELNIDLDLDPAREVEYSYQTLSGADKDRVVILTTGSYKQPETIDWGMYNYNDYAIYMVSVFDRNSGSTVNKIDLVKDMDSNEYVESTSYANGKFSVRTNSMTPDTYENISREKIYDLDTGTVAEVREIVTDSYYTSERSFQIGDYRVVTVMDWESTYQSYDLYVYVSDNDFDKVRIQKDGVDIYDIPVILSEDGNKALIPASTNDGELFFELDLRTCKLTELDPKDYEWLDTDHLTGAVVRDDGCLYYADPLGITKADINKKTSEKLFDYSWCGINRSILTNLTLADCSDDGFILYGEHYANNAYKNNKAEFKVIEFTRAKKNPHAGKTILELYTPYGYTDEAVGDAIMRFNETNGSCFIEVTDRYNNDDYIDYSNIDSDDDYDTMNLDAAAKMSNVLAMDIMNGEGPDILLDCSEYGQLNNANYLVDLTPYVGSLDGDKYFTNIIEGSKIDGKIYQLPVTFTVFGIHTDAKYAGATGVGFTTAEYEKFLNDTLNGSDVITSGQAVYFSKLFNNMSGLFISNGKVDFTGPEFAQIAAFVKDNVPERSRSWSEDLELYAEESYPAVAVGASVFKGDPYGSEPLIAMYTRCSGMGTYLYDISQLQGAEAILGLPSTDGRGPVFEPNLSVAVSAQSANADACGEFVKILLSDDFQTAMAYSDYLVLNRDSLRKAGEDAVKYYSSDVFVYDVRLPNSGSKFTSGQIDSMENIIMSCSGMSSTDSSVNLILIEEMPAYFSGQKDLASVAAIAQDRVQKVMDERG